jgi:hypothetical protein
MLLQNCSWVEQRLNADYKHYWHVSEMSIIRACCHANAFASRCVAGSFAFDRLSFYSRMMRVFREISIPCVSARIQETHARVAS